MKRIGYILTLLGLLLSPVYTFFDGASARLKDNLHAHESALAKLNAESDSIMNIARPRLLAADVATRSRKAKRANGSVLQKLRHVAK